MTAPAAAAGPRRAAAEVRKRSRRVGHETRPAAPIRARRVGGPSTCQYVFFEPRATTPLLHRGNWRAAGIEQVSADLDVQQGRFGGIFCVFLVSDPGTPGNANDDCTLVLIHPDPAPAAPGWQRYVFPLPTASATAARDPPRGARRGG